MSEIHKLICDECGKEKDLIGHSFGNQEDWQRFMFKGEYGQIINRHACSVDCAIKVLQKKASNE